MRFIAFQKNQSEPGLSTSGVITPPTTCIRLNILKINAKNIPTAMSWEMAPIINIFFVDIYLCIIQRGISRKNAIRFAKARNNHTRATFRRRNVKKNIIEK